MIHADEMATIWVLRGGDRDRLVKAFLDDGQVGVEFPEFPDGRTVDRGKAIRLLGGGSEPSKSVEHEAAMFLSFVRRIGVTDVVLLRDRVASGFVCGVVTSDYEFRPDLGADRARHRRSVDWRRRLPFSLLPERLEKLPAHRPVLDDVPDGRLRDLALRCCRGELGDDPFDRPAGVVPSTPKRRSSGARAPARPKPAPKPERRCLQCLMSKSYDFFDGADEICIDCS